MPRLRLLVPLLLTLAGCAQVNEMTAFGTVRVNKSDSEGRHVLETAPRYLVGTDGRSATFGGNAIGGRWESTSPEVISVTLLYRSSRSGSKAKTRFDQVSVNLDGNVTDFAITQPTVQRRGKFDYASWVYFTENRSSFQMPLSYLRQMLDAESCIVSVATSTGIAEGDFTVASSSGYPTARASLSKLYEQIPTTQKAEKVEK